MCIYLYVLLFIQIYISRANAEYFGEEVTVEGGLMFVLYFSSVQKFFYSIYVGIKMPWESAKANIINELIKY